jgi:hypothetical protein
MTSGDYIPLLIASLENDESENTGDKTILLSRLAV